MEGLCHRMVVRWLVTVALVLSCLRFTDPAAYAVTLASSLHVAICWAYYVITAFTRARSGISNFDEFKDLVLRLPEFKIWDSTTKAVVVALIVITFFPNFVMELLSLCYVVSVCAVLFCVCAVQIIKQNEKTSVNNSRWIDVELQATSNKKDQFLR